MTIQAMTIQAITIYVMSEMCPVLGLVEHAQVDEAITIQAITIWAVLI